MLQYIKNLFKSKPSIANDFRNKFGDKTWYICSFARAAAQEGARISVGPHLCLEKSERDYRGRF